MSTVVFETILEFAFPFEIIVFMPVVVKASELAENIVLAGSREILRDPVTPFNSALPEDMLASVPVEFMVWPDEVVVPEPTAFIFEITADVIPFPDAPPPMEVDIEPALGANAADVLVVVPSVEDAEF